MSEQEATATMLRLFTEADMWVAHDWSLLAGLLAGMCFGWVLAKMKP